MTRILTGAVSGLGRIMGISKPEILGKEHFLNGLKKISEKFSYDLNYEENENKMYGLRYDLIKKYFGKEDQLVTWLSEVISDSTKRGVNDIKYKCQAINCFKHFYHRENIELFINCLSDDSPSIREAAILTIGQAYNRDKERVLPLLIKQLNDPNFQVCEAAITALKYIGGKEGYNALHEFSKDYSPDKLWSNRQALLAMAEILWKQSISSTPTENQS